jgi:mannosyltransferase
VNRDRVLRVAGPVVGGCMAIGLGLYRVEDESLWLDEGRTATVASGSWSALIDFTIAREPNGGLYYSAVKVWASFGSSELNLRLLSVLSTAVTAALVAVLAYRLFGGVAGLVAGAVFATNPFVIEYAQEARVYALAALLTVAAALLLVEALNRGAPAWWIAWGVTTVLLVYAHAAAVVVVAAFGAAILLHPKRPAAPALLTGSLAIGVALVPLAVLLLRADTRWLDWIPEPALSDISPTVESLAGGESPLIAFAIAGAAALIVAVRRPLARSWGLLFSALLAVLPIALLFTASYLKPLFLSRYLIVAVPGMVLLATAGIRKLRFPALMLVAGAVFVVLAAPHLDDGYVNRSKEDWRGVAAAVAAQAQPGDVVVVYPFGFDTFRYYHDGHPILSSAEILTNRVDDRHDRVWLVVYEHRREDGAATALAEAIEADHPDARQWSFRGLVVGLYSRA